MPSGLGVPQRNVNDCPRCGQSAQPLEVKPEDSAGGLVERALECESCDDTYLRINGRWWAAGKSKP